jgi:Asp-tRNA(Asn)/Glu-tRNA(Gln) amidotransferase A subunit family amidase
VSAPDAEGGTDSLCYLPAHRQLELFREKRLSPVDVLTAQMLRIESVGPSINAITYQHFDQALAAARESEARYIRGAPRALDGITIAVKDEYQRRGWTVTAGSRIHEDDVAKETDPVLHKLTDAGAILHIQTTAPEYYLLGVTWSDLWGVTRNPWNPACTPGGSSGGSAAALAAGFATLAIGSDMGGSIRIPCALNGLYGSKPAYGRIASHDPSALVPHASPGPLAREFPDLILLQNAMTGPAPGCPAVLRPALELAGTYAARPWRIALSMHQGWATVAPDVRANTLAAAKRLEAAGARIEEVELPLETDDEKLRETIENALFSTALGADLLELEPHKAKLTSYGKRFVELAQRMGPRQAKSAAEEALRLYGIIDSRVFQKGFDALITPTVATTEVPAAFDPTRDRITIEGRRVDPYSGWFMTSLFSLLNWMPVMAVPTGRASNGVPTGMQVVARPYEDPTAAAVASVCAQHGPGLPFATTLVL